MSNFKVLFPPNGQQVFDGGQNSKFERTLIENNESPDCLNIVFDGRAIQTRDGFKKLNTASVGSFACDGLYTRQGTNNAETMVAFFNGSAFALAGTSMITIPSAQSIFTAGVRVGSSQMENHIYFGNGYTEPYKYNGTDFTRHGVNVPSMTAVFATGAAGSPSGAYQYKFVWLNSQSVRGNASSGSATIVVAATKVELTSIPVAPQSFGVSTREIYRTVTSGATFLRVAVLSDNTTTTYSDNIADSALGTTAPTDKGLPPKYSTIVYHQNRLFCNDLSNPQFVWYSDLNEPYTFGALNFLTIGDGSSDFVTAIEVQDNSIVVFGQKSIWIVYMQDTTPANWVVVKAKSNFSSKSPYGLFKYGNRIGFPAMQNDKFAGIGAIAGDAVEPTTSTLTVATMGGFLKSDKIENEMFSIQEAYVGNISSIVFQNRAHISMTYGTGATTNNRVYIYDFANIDMSNKQSEAWIPWSGISVAQWAVYGGSLYYGSSTANGFIFKQDDGVYADNGSAINSYFWTKEFLGLPGHEHFHKDFRYTNLLVDLAGTYFMGLTIKTDSDLGSGTDYQIDLNPHTYTWGSMVWGTDPWGGGAISKDIRVFLSAARGKRIQYKFSNKNTVNQMFKVHYQNFTYNLKGPR